MKRVISLLCALLLLSCCALADRGTPEIEPVYTARTVVIRCAGDFVIHQSLIDAAKREGSSGTHSFAKMLQDVSAFLADADFTVTNVDGVLGGQDIVGKYGYSGYPAFSTPAQLIYDLKDCGVDMLTLANNHALDFWYDGLKSTVTSVEEAGLMSVGGYRTQEEKLTPRVRDIGGIRFGFLNYTDGLNQMDKRSALDKAALAYGVDFLERANIPADIQRLRSVGAEIIVCFMHWGIEYRTEPCLSQKQNAQMLADMGVDVIIGSHPHTVQRAEYIQTADADGQPKQVLCLYSLGNFLSDQRQEGRDAGMIFDFTVTRDEDGLVTVSDPVYRTTWVWRRQINGYLEYRVLFSGTDAARPQGMSEADYRRMQQSAAQTIAVMNQGCALPAREESALMATPER